MGCPAPRWQRPCARFASARLRMSAGTTSSTSARWMRTLSSVSPPVWTTHKAARLPHFGERPAYPRQPARQGGGPGQALQHVLHKHLFDIFRLVEEVFEGTVGGDNRSDQGERIDEQRGLAGHRRIDVAVAAQEEGRAFGIEAAFDQRTRQAARAAPLQAGEIEDAIRDLQQAFLPA